jgi:hypothetical protein
MPDYVTIVDALGAPVWYVGVSSALSGDFQQQPDGTFTLALDDPSQRIPGLLEGAATINQYDVLGNLLRSWSAISDANAMPDPATISATDVHDVRLQPNGDVLLLGFDELTQVDMTPFGGIAGASVVGDVLQRVTSDGRVVFSWDAFKHLSYENIDRVSTNLGAAVVDFTHANAVDVMQDGSYLLSLRNLSQALKIDPTTGEILWKLGGSDSSFTFVNDPLVGFSCQHAVRGVASTDGLTHIILFDDGPGHIPPQSRAVEYALDVTAKTATLVWSSLDSPPLYTDVLGNAQRLPNGNTVVSFGQALHVHEVDGSGKVLWDLYDPTASFGLYRAFRISSLYRASALSE